MEDFYDQMPDDEMDRFADGVKRFEFDSYLGAYQEDHYSDWISLSNFINPKVLNILEPVGKKISSLLDTGEYGKEEIKKEAKKNAKAQSEFKELSEETNESEETKESINIKNSQTAYYSSIPFKKAPKGATPQQITKYNFDRSEILQGILKRRYQNDPTGILGELQFSFICFLMGQSFDGFEQWKQLVALFCCSDDAASSIPELFNKFIAVLHFQLKQAPEDFFIDNISGENFLVSVLRQLFEILNDDQLEKKLVETKAKFKSYIEKRFGRTFNVQEDDEDAPVVVDA